MRIHREGTKIVLITGIIVISAIMIAARFLSMPVFIIISAILIGLMFLVLRFFRVPRRIFFKQEDFILAPADGTIVNIEKIYEPEYFKQEMLLVSIFMSIHNIHINWFPISGSIKYFKYHPGDYLVARHPKSSELNERTSVVIERSGREILVRQIAGYVARRIVCYANPGKTVTQSEEMGFIKFGSRLDLYLPTDAAILIKNGDKTIGGISPIASFKK